jgi:DNA-binding CsgD family transcriptional regulator
MQNNGINAPVTSEGFLLLDSCLNPIFVNRAAAEILSYPQKPPEARKNLNAFLASKIHLILFSAQTSDAPALVTAFVSGKRRYHCRAYRVDVPGNGSGSGNGGGHVSIAVLLERFSTASLFIGQVSERFHLTTREQEVLQHLLVGQTTKEIATGMEISPHTVKAFLRMIMVKMGVSTRSAIVGKAFTSRQ